MNVLIVEDDNALAQELALFLQHERYHCDFARTGAEASEKLYVNEYDFVLLDLGLPDRDGLQLLAEARKQHNLQASIIILSARAQSMTALVGCSWGPTTTCPSPIPC
ncbi:response regulator [Hymenobacter cellulosilyticus]|uniref:Response regulator n=1 Tax=Hymenobacter cellulosilyticus TaxID=2932248 RepID=A0A8T9QCA8_9BACT|nr:response regulator [Hymenobacter cellulosilyticus]UOQ74562.1 response regulator [Hymenobacter cellulosilyticus]